MSGSIVGVRTNNVGEGSGYPGSIIASIQTTGFKPGSTLYYRFKGQGVGDEDFSLGGLFGSSRAQGWTNIGSDGWAYITHTIGADNKTEGDELVRIDIASNSDFASVLSSSSSFVIRDTSVGPSYSISAPSEVVEGQKLVLRIKTRSLTGDLNPNRSGDQQFLAWKLTGNGYESSDLDGSYPLDGGGVSVRRTGDDDVTLSIGIKADGKAEGQEQWKVSLFSRMEAASTYEVASATFNVKDFSDVLSESEMSSSAIGYYLVSSGTDSRDFRSGLTSGNAYFAKGGNDYISTSGKTYLPYQGKNWWIPSLICGGEGDDEYNVGPGAAVVIADGSSSNGDSLRIYDYITNVTDFFSVDNRHVFIGTSWGTYVLVVDAMNGSGAIESISFSDISLSANPSSVKALLSQYQTRSDQSLAGLQSQGLFNPNVMGVDDAQVQGLIDSIYKSSFASATSLADVANKYIDSYGQSFQSVLAPTGNALLVTASSWSESIQVKTVARAANSGSRLDSEQVDWTGLPQGSLLLGAGGNDQLWGKAGWDILDGAAGNDLIRAGNGRDIIIGGLGADELHGDFGWNTYKSEKDGFSDLIAIKSDEWIVNWLYGKAGNNSDGAKCDIIEGLDAIDKIKIIGVDTLDITFAANVTTKGLTGIGIYGKGALEALYTGGDLTINQITQMTSGDASAAAMANQVSSYGVW